MLKSLTQLIAILLLLASVNLSAQQNPPDISWKSIDTGTYLIIFPEEITPLGQRVANLMVHYEKYNYSSIKTEPRRIPIVLINQYAEANGFVSFAPFYSHWFTTPSSFASGDWFKGLAIHEGRHMVQINKMKDGKAKKAWRYLFGEYGTAILATLYVPAWFFEGDAVVMETALSKGGRGRMPYFDLWYRGLELSDIRYSYYETDLGSYDSLYPYSDHYKYGYLLCSYIRKHYGKDVWDKVLEDTGRFFVARNFDTSLRKNTGKTIKEHYQDAFNEFRSIWKDQQSGLKFTEAKFLNPDIKQTDKWDSYLYPFTSGDGHLTAVQFSGDRSMSLVKFNEKNGQEIIERIPLSVASAFISNERGLSAGGNSVIWCESISDPRWGYRSFSDIKILNLKTGKTKYLTDNRKFLSSSISSDGKIAAGIEYGPDLKYFLTILDTESGKEISRDEIKDKGYLFDSAISPDNKNIAMIALLENSTSILLYNLETKTITLLVGYTNREHLRAPVFYGDYIIYGSDYSGIDNIYAVDIKTKKRYQVVSRPFGAYFPYVRGNTLYFNDYTIYGYKAASMLLNKNEWTPFEKVKNNQVNFINPVAEQELAGDKGMADDIPDTEYDVKNYHPVTDGMTIIGWIPWLGSTPTDFVISIASMDVLHTTNIVLAYDYNSNEHTNYGYASIVYNGFYPVISMNGGYGGRTAYYEDKTTTKKDDYVYSKWNEISGYGKLSLPLNFSAGIYSTYLTLSAGTGYIKVYDKKSFDFTVNEGMNANGDLHYFEYTLSFIHLIQGALHSVTPGDGFTLDVSYSNTPLGGDYQGSLFSSTLVLYLPGITDIQGTKISGSYERIGDQNHGINYQFKQKFLFPRGYDPVRMDNLYMGSFDYAFPILNFSSNIWKLIYFKRLNGDIFFDYGIGRMNDNSTSKENTFFRSAGIELTAEQNWFSNKYLALELGVRYSYCFDYHENTSIDKHNFDIVLKVPVN